MQETLIIFFENYLTSQAKFKTFLNFSIYDCKF